MCLRLITEQKLTHVPLAIAILLVYFARGRTGHFECLFVTMNEPEARISYAAVERNYTRTVERWKCQMSTVLWAYKGVSGPLHPVSRAL